MTPEKYFRKWSENCRIFQNYKPIHSHEDMMDFAKKYHEQQLILKDVGCSLPIKKEIVFSDSLKIEIQTIDSNLKVLRAVNGWGKAIDMAKIHINEK